MKAETKLTKEQRRIVAKYYEAVGDGMDVEDALAAAINDYAAQKQAEHERVLAVLREMLGRFASPETIRELMAMDGKKFIPGHRKYGIQATDEEIERWRAALLAAEGGE